VWLGVDVVDIVAVKVAGTIVRVFVEAGTDVTVEDKDGTTGEADVDD
jgi:hypothetical protein